MTLEPAVRAHLDAMAESSLAPADMVAFRVFLTAEIDRMFEKFGEPGPPVADVRDHRVPVSGGAEIVVRTYHPDPAAVLPAHVVLHGGGWTTGSIDELVADGSARHRAVRANCVVVLVEYRLAPEHRFPIPVHDVVAAVRWLTENAVALGVDPATVTLGGSSAGANLAAAAVVAEPALGIAALLLEVPALDLTLGTATATCADLVVQHGPDSEIGDLLSRTLALLDRARRDYLGHLELAELSTASPLLVPDLTRFPPTYIQTAQWDPLRTDGSAFVQRLRDAGVRASVTCYPGALHGSPILTATWPTARRWQDDLIARLVDVHGRA
ncbi:alpha/beta hydrolase [Fodinicola feengrottensis]|uniref:Alpha/beta hydrolase n=1 Tax=Fodinicola feengrottensis TaxID=435914 RepID=A0ABN2IUI2_9ACTN